MEGIDYESKKSMQIFRVALDFVGVYDHTRCLRQFPTTISSERNYFLARLSKYSSSNLYTSIESPKWNLNLDIVSYYKMREAIVHFL